MAIKRDKVADGLSALAVLKQENDPQKLELGLSKLIADAPSYVVTRAANYSTERGLRGLVGVASERLLKLTTSAKSDDIGCDAALAIVQMLISLEAGYEAETAALSAIRFERYESVYGGSVDVAVSLRGNSAILLAAMGSREALRCASELLAESDQKGPRERTSWPARADAAKALSMIGSDGAAALLRFKLILGDNEPTVLSECLSGLLTIDREHAIPNVEKMIASQNTSHQEAAILAIGNWRDPRAIDLLIKYEQRFIDSPSIELYLASIAMTRHPQGIEHLLKLIQSTNKRIKTAALKAIEPLRVIPHVAAKLDGLL